MLELLKKIVSWLGVTFSWNRTHSPSQASNAKSKFGNSAATTGDNSPALSAGGNINYYNTITPPVCPTENALKAKDAWEKLLACFTPNFATQIAQSILDHRRSVSQKDGSDIINFISQKFMGVTMPTNAPCAHDFIIERDLACKAIEILTKSKNETEFREQWEGIGERLAHIKGILNLNKFTSPDFGGYPI